MRRPAILAAVKPRDQTEEEQGEAGQDRGADRLQRSLEVLQQLKKRKEVPLRARRVGRVGRIGEPLERSRMPRGQPEEREDEEQPDDGVAPRLVRKERLTRIGT